jgi:glycosyltransferase involved in cell wall biosynthesis
MGLPQLAESSMIWGDDFSNFDFEPEVPSVSFVCPTRNRPARHEHLYLQYAQQTVSPKELIVGDEGEAPSEFFRQLDDPTVHYTYFPEKLTLGDKRNRLNDMAAGDVIAHLDDDDYYAPRYAEHMLRRLCEHDLVRLSEFRVLDERSGDLFECDTLRSPGRLAGERRILGLKIPVSGIPIPTWLSGSSDALKLGYGFSYVYTRSLWADVRFDPETTLREDVDFAKRCIARGARLGQVGGVPHLAVHVVHDASTSTAFVTARLGRMAIRTALSQVVGGGPFGFMFGHAVDRALLLQ